MRKLIFLLILLFPSNTFCQKLVTGEKDTNFIQNQYPPITGSELDSLEKYLSADENYHWKVLGGDRQRTIALILAAQKRKPDSTCLWVWLQKMRFAQDKFEARSLPDKERKERYLDALGYLQEFAQSAESAVKSNPDNLELKKCADLLIEDIVFAALESGELDIAKSLAEKILNMAKEMLIDNPDTSSQYGEAVYKANSILGRVALREGNLDASKMYLLKSGTKPGSAYREYYGPSLILDREILEKGEKDAVLEHLDQVGKFWKIDEVAASNEVLSKLIQDPGKILETWKKEIGEGKIPDDPMWK